MRATHVLLTFVTGVLCGRHNPILPRGDPSAPSYEYVVVGSGPGGGTLAANLAEAGHRVLLIDAGGDHGDELAQRVAGLVSCSVCSLAHYSYPNHAPYSPVPFVFIALGGDALIYAPRMTEFGRQPTLIIVVAPGN